MSPTHGPQEDDQAKKEAELKKDYEAALSRFPVLKSMTHEEMVVFLARQYAALTDLHTEAIHDILAVQKRNKKETKE